MEPFERVPRLVPRGHGARHGACLGARLGTRLGARLGTRLASARRVVVHSLSSLSGYRPHGASIEPFERISQYSEIG